MKYGRASGSMAPAIVLAAALFTSFSADGVQLPSVFGDNMVLQRGQTVPVWGKGRPGERVTVKFAGATAGATVAADGTWRAALPPLAASSEGAVFTVVGDGGDEAVAFTNVVVGEVWFCSGQSNMEYTMSARRKVKDWEREVAAAQWPLIRHFRVAHKTATEPLDDVSAKWEETTPQTIPPQSAVAFFFGETLHKELDVPVGLINASWGGTRIEPWTPAGHPDDLWLLQNLKHWDRPHDVPTTLWNGMVAGLVPFAIRGAIWYQGCANRIDGEAYLQKTIALVRGWRREWGQGNFPYYLVQLAPYGYGNVRDTSLALFQETQARVPDAVPNSGYTVINDVGDVNDIHPTDKRTVGTRLADQVLDRVYGKFVRPWKTPVAKDAVFGTDSVRISFSDADGLKTRDGLPPNEFELRDVLGKWRVADAKIEESDVVLTAAGVTNPIAMRFAGHNGSTPNLVNGSGLPAGPFHFGKPYPFGLAAVIPESAGFTCIQRYDIPECCNLAKDPPAAIGAPLTDVARVGYLLELEQPDGDTKYAFAEMDAFSPLGDELRLRGGELMPNVRVLVSNLVVVSNVDGIDTDGERRNGVVEFYGSNYSPRKAVASEDGLADKYDSNDAPSEVAAKVPGFGCLQVHDSRTKRPVLCFNHFNSSNVPCDVGIGKAPGDQHPDWTHSRNSRGYSARRISVWVKRAPESSVQETPAAPAADEN